MTRDELLELLLVERFGPTPPRPTRTRRPSRPVLVPLDSEGAIEARRGVLERIPISGPAAVDDDTGPVEDTA